MVDVLLLNQSQREVAVNQEDWVLLNARRKLMGNCLSCIYLCPQISLNNTTIEGLFE